MDLLPIPSLVQSRAALSTGSAQDDDTKLAMDAAGVGAWRWDLAADAVSVSDAALALLGGVESVLSYEALLSLIHPADRTLVGRALHAGMTTDDLQDFDFRIVSAEGFSEWRRMRGRRCGVGLARGILIDVARRKTARDANNRLAAIVAFSEDAIIANTLDGTVVDWNHGAETIFGYSAAEMIGHSISVLMRLEQDAEEAAILARLKQGERVEHFETQRLRRDGVVIDVSVTISPIWDDSGQLVGASQVARDITDRQQTQRRLQELQAELIHMSRFTAMGEMASTLAHELNQPLSAVANYLKGGRRLLEGGHSDAIPKAREAMERATEQALRAGQIIRHLREFVTRGESEHKPEDLVTLIEQASALALVGIKETGVRVSFDFDPRAKLVMAAKVQIQQVLLNLIRNAIEAMQDSVVRQMVISTSLMGEGMVQVSVSDTGPGIVETVIPNLFKPFFTTKPEGMGVGLSISRTIVEAHRGRLWAEPRPAGGTVFRLTLKTATEYVTMGQENP